MNMPTHAIDAKGKKVGRLASEIAVILQGKKDPAYEKRMPGGDSVVVTNIAAMEITGKKYETKTYYRPSTRIGAMKKRTYRQIMEKNPDWILRHAVRLMLPKNRLAKPRMKRLVIE